jgi:arylsulfatase A-like enzyme
VNWDYGVTLPGVLAQAGYHTQGVGKMHFFPPRSLMGFHNVVLHDGYLHHERRFSRNYELADDYWRWLKDKVDAEVDFAAHGLAANSWVARPWDLDERLHPTNWVVSQSIDFLRRRDRRRPFFLWMSFVRPHAPLDPPECYFEQYLRQEMPPVPVGDWAERSDPGREGLDPNAASGLIGERQLHRARAGYYALMTHIDHQIGRFREALIEDEVEEDTVVLFTSDHGELMGDHNLFRKVLPYEGSTRVPLLIRAPQRFGLVALSTVSAPVELRDVMPTLLDAAGVAIPPSVEGRSLLPLARGERAAWREHIHGEHSGGRNSNHWVTDGGRKYVWYSQTGREQMFDLERDPQELRDLSRESSARAGLERLRSILTVGLTGREEGYVDSGRLVAGRPPQATLRKVLGDV